MKISTFILASTADSRTTSDGKTSGHVCTACGETLDGFDVIPKLAVSAAPISTELPIDFNTFKEDLNKARNEKSKTTFIPTSNRSFPQLQPRF